MIKLDNKYNYPLFIIISLWTIVTSYTFIYTSIDKHYCATPIVQVSFNSNLIYIVSIRLFDNNYYK